AILKSLPFPGGYQVIFAIGDFGAAMSSYHIFHVRPLADTSIAPPSDPIPVSDPRPSPARGFIAALRIDIWRTDFKKVLLALFIFHFSHYLSSPLYPLYNVRVLNLNDNNIGIGTALYYLTVLIASTQLGRIVHRFGNKRVTGWGVASMATYPIMLAFSQNVFQFYGLSFLNGFLFAMVNGAYANYLLERIPPDDRPSHLAWYTIMFNLAVLTSSLIGPLAADAIGLAPALIIFGVARILAGIFLLKWG
ncbi:MAG: MFS transporter, partial [Anaerolineales bacterium]|nr:MFS transporter [Anaerolineales bacterium]